MGDCLSKCLKGPENNSYRALPDHDQKYPPHRKPCDYYRRYGGKEYYFDSQGKLLIRDHGNFHE
jgi:hypothetical protein